MLNAVFDTYFQDKPTEEIIAEYGEPSTRAPNNEIFSAVYSAGFSYRCESMYIENEKIGIAFVFDKAYPYDYEYIRKYSGGQQFHMEYGICLIYDEYVNNLPEVRTNIRESMDFIFLEHITDTKEVLI